MIDDKPTIDPGMLALLAHQSKRRLRLTQWQKDWVIVHGFKLRGRGRPRKDEPKNVIGGRAARP
jgi:hypothetical protein